MSLLANQFGLFQGHRSATSILLWSQRFVPEGRRPMRVSGRSCFFTFRLCGQFSLSCPCRRGGSVSSRASGNSVSFGVGAGSRLAASPVVCVAQAASRYLRRFSVVRVSRFVVQNHAEKTAPSSSQCSNPALNPAPFSRWTLRDKAAPRRLALRSPYMSA